MPRKAKRNPNGSGSVFWSESEQRYIGSIALPGGGRRRVCGKRGDDRPTAKLEVTERLAKLRKRKPTLEGRTRLGDFIDEWLKNAEHLAANSLAVYRWAFHSYIEGSALAKIRVSDVERTDIQEFFANLKPPAPKPRKDGSIPKPRSTKVGVPTKKRLRGLLHCVFEEIIDLEIIDRRNPVRKLKLPKTRNTSRAWTPEEAIFFLREARHDRLYAMYLLSLTTTMGPAELFGLEKSDVHLKGGYLSVRQNLEDVSGKVDLKDAKNDWRRRRIELPEIVVEALHEHLRKNIGGGALVFTAPEGGPIRRQNLRKREYKPLLERVAKKAEDEAAERGDSGYRFPRIKLYDMRHTCNALMGYLGVPIQVAKERMGHSSIKTTVDVYGHNYESQQRDVARRFDDFLAPLKQAEK